MGNVIENFVQDKMFGGIIGNASRGTSSTHDTQSTSTEVRFEGSESSGEKYIQDVKAKQARVNSWWNRFKQRFGFGEELTAQEEKVLIQERIKEMRRRTSGSASDW